MDAGRAEPVLLFQLFSQGKGVAVFYEIFTKISCSNSFGADPVYIKL